MDDATIDAAILVAAQRVVLATPMLGLDLPQVLQVPGVDPAEVVAVLRRRGVLLALPDPVSGDLRIPAFQVDRRLRRVHPVVAIVNATLGAADDPWGVGSWWVSPHGRLGQGQAPMHLVGTDAEPRLPAIANSLRAAAVSAPKPEDLVTAPTPSGAHDLNIHDLPAAETDRTALDIREVTRRLNDDLGGTLVAVLGGARDSQISAQWAYPDGPAPSLDAETRLRAAHRIWVALTDGDGDAHTALKWLTGLDPVLDQVPVLAIREGRVREASQAAQAFLNGVWPN